MGIYGYTRTFPVSCINLRQVEKEAVGRCGVRPGAGLSKTPLQLSNGSLQLSGGLLHSPHGTTYATVVAVTQSLGRFCRRIPETAARQVRGHCARCVVAPPPRCPTTRIRPEVRGNHRNDDRQLRPISNLFQLRHLGIVRLVFDHALDPVHKLVRSYDQTAHRTRERRLRRLAQGGSQELVPCHQFYPARPNHAPLIPTPGLTPNLPKSSPRKSGLGHGAVG